MIMTFACSYRKYSISYGSLLQDFCNLLSHFQVKNTSYKFVQIFTCMSIFADPICDAMKCFRIRFAFCTIVTIMLSVMCYMYMLLPWYRNLIPSPSKTIPMPPAFIDAVENVTARSDIRLPLVNDSIQAHSENESLNNRSFVFSLSFKDQMTNAVARIRSLQCWARQWNMFVVEPFANDTFFRTPYDRNLSYILQNTFRHYFDLKTWNDVGTKYQLPVFVGWEEFVANASRELILVHIIYKLGPGCLETPFTAPFRDCDSGFLFLRSVWFKFLAKEHFSVVKEVCIDMRKYDFIEATEFNHLIFGDRQPPYTVVFNEWRGIATHSKLTGYINIRKSNCTFKSTI